MNTNRTQKTIPNNSFRCGHYLQAGTAIELRISRYTSPKWHSHDATDIDRPPPYEYRMLNNPLVKTHSARVSQRENIATS